VRTIAPWHAWSARSGRRLPAAERPRARAAAPAAAVSRVALGKARIVGAPFNPQEKNSMSVPSPATADPSSPREPFEVALLDAARTLAAARLQGFLEAHAPTGTLVAALTSVFPGIDAVSAARHLRALAAGTDWPAIRLVSAQDLPDGLAAYHAQTGTVLVSDRAFALDAMEPGLVADLLLQHCDGIVAAAGAREGAPRQRRVEVGESVGR